MPRSAPAPPITAASVYLRGLAHRLAAAYVVHTPARAAILVGSAAVGDSDTYSDVDVGVLYDDLPSAAQVDAARAAVVRELGAQLLPWPSGDRYLVDGVDCQVARLTLEAVDRDLDRTLSPQFREGDQKAFSGWRHAIALHGGELVEARRARLAAYPDDLARATVRRYLRFQPIWRAPEKFAVRDATLFFHQSVVEACFNVLGILAGLNRQPYATFQFKRMRAFTATLRLTPPDLPDRIEWVLARLGTDPAATAYAVEALVAETVALVEAHLSEVDVADAKRTLGKRQVPWQLPREDEP